jgi:signal transduction histidine kinase
LKFTPSGGEVKIICELIEEAGDYGMLKVSVKDNGVGIKQEDQGKLFRLFGFLEQTQKINTKGIGIGLYICKKIVNIFGGEVEVQSEFGQGSTFSFTFMLDKPEAMDNATVSRTLNPKKLPIRPQIVI